MAGLTWLHLSDWHQKGADFDRQVVRDALLKDLQQRARIDPALGQIDFVVFSGDVAWHGKREEFEAAREFLFEPVLKAVGLGPKELFLVPGNHDLDRKWVENMLPAPLQKPLQSDQEVQTWLLDERTRQRALEPFEEYARFVKRFTGQDPADYGNTRVWFVGAKTVGILGLNSAWMCGRNKNRQGEVDDKGHLTLGEPQVHEALKRIEGADVRLAVLHHPFEWLATFDRDRVEKPFQGGCHFILHGHEHRPNFSLSCGPAGEYAVIPAGAGFAGRTPKDPRYANAYNLVHLDFETGRGKLLFRRWSDGGKQWIADTDAHAGGRFEFRLPKELGSARPSKTSSAAKAGPSPRLPAAVAPSSALGEYLRRLEAATGKLQLIGLGPGVQLELPIAQAHIPLNVVVARGLRNDALGHFDGKVLRQCEQVEENVLLGDLFKWAARFESRGVLLLGDPGAGKTTGARQFCWRVLHEPDLPKSLGLPSGTLPVFLRLRDLTSHHLGQGLTAFIIERVAATALPPELAQPGPELLARKGVLWVFDGLDEVVNEKARVHVCGWIKQALEQRPDDLFLVTSRYQGYQGPVDLGPAFCQFHVQPLKAPQVEAFVAHWYRAVCRKLYGAAEATEEKAAGLIGSLMKLLQEPEYRIGRLRELPANPLLLTILCVVHQQDRNLPRRRADLYARCARVLIEHWRKDAFQEQEVAAFDPEAAESVLGEVAWSLHGNENRICHTVEGLGAVAARALLDVAPAAGLGRDGAAFIRRMRDESGVLAMWGVDQCGFLHLTFQEYLAGLRAARQGRVEELVAHVGQSWWREVILVAVAVGWPDFALKFFTALVQSEVVAREGAFVDQCLDEARHPVLEPFLEALRDQRAPAPRQLHLLRRLRQREHPDLVKVCRELARSKHAELAALAREVLQRAGSEAERATIQVVGAPLELRVDQRTGIAFISLPAGEFDMGSDTRHDDEKPVHRVRLSTPFLLGKYPVTNQEYQRFLQANPKAKPPEFWNNSQFNDPTQPVVGVSWDDAQAFCAWAGCRLPTEAEWECACRAGSDGEFCFGDGESKLGEYAWYGANSGNKTRPVGQKKPNLWGLHDMHGNVYEWCQDWKAQYPKGLVEDPTGPKEGQNRVLRGGSWDHSARNCRSAYRFSCLPSDRYLIAGFRVVLAPRSDP